MAAFFMLPLGALQFQQARRQRLDALFRQVRQATGWALTERAEHGHLGGSERVVQVLQDFYLTISLVTGCH
jgi:hypothetical protein